MSVGTIVSDRVRVLVVEDGEDQRGLLLRHFERAGCEVMVAGTAHDAILAYSRWAPDLAVIDLVLSGSDGWMLTDRLRADRPDCIIAITSVLDRTDHPLAEVVLPRPFTGAQIRRVLRDFVPKWTGR